MRSRELRNAWKAVERLVEAIRAKRESLDPEARTLDEDLNQLYLQIDRPIRILVEESYK